MKLQLTPLFKICSLKKSSDESDHFHTKSMALNRYLERLWMACKAEYRVWENTLRMIEQKEKCGVWKRKKASGFLPVHTTHYIVGFLALSLSLHLLKSYSTKVSFLNFLSMYRWYLKEVHAHLPKITFLELSIILI